MNQLLSMAGEDAGAKDTQAEEALASGEG